MFKAIKTSFVNRADGFRVQVRRRLGPDAIQRVFAEEQIGALGLASGALVGTLL